MSNEFIEEYNQFLAGENSAVETYALALKTVKSDSLRAALLECQNCHSKRADKLSAAISNLGGAPSTSAGVWGPFAAASQKGATTETESISLLEQSEAERLVQYEAQQGIVVSPVLDVLKEDLLPAQHRTHLKISSLLKTLLPLPQ